MLRKRIRNKRLCLAALAVLAPLQVLATTSGEGDDRAATAAGQLLADPPPLPARVVPQPLDPAATSAATPSPTPTPVLTATGPMPAPAAPGQLVTEPDVVPTASRSADTAPAPAAAAPAAAPAASGFAQRFPAQAAAVQDPADPATTRWALLIGINEHRGGVSDNVGSRQDAEDLRTHLLASGWRDDHILLLTDGNATRTNIIDGMAWLAERTDEDSVAVFHYSGHSKKWYGRDVDGDGEITDEGLWPTDGRFIVDSEVSRALDRVQPHAFWISFATCNAAGFADPGMVQPGRILTFSSGEPQKSYEHPAWGNSVWGWLLIDQAVASGVADADHDGRVTVEEAFVWARPRAHETTRGQRHGPQDAVIVDQVPGGFDLLIPGGPRPERQVDSEPQDQPEAQPAPAPPPDGGQQQPPPDRERDEEDRGLCLLCG